MPAPRRVSFLLVGLLIGMGLYLVGRAASLPSQACMTAFVTGVCATYWVTEPMPIAVTSIIPFVAFPLLGVMDHNQVALAYGHTLILLLLGGFILSTAMERSGAHRRLAFLTIQLIGNRGAARLVLGFMVATAMLSMWISNTATTLMMLPIAIAVLDQSGDKRLAAPLMLGIAYSASIGGLGTPIGTPPNIIFMAAYEETTGAALSFVAWMKVGCAAALVMLPIAWLVLVRRLKGVRAPAVGTLGPWLPKERRVLMVFAFAALLWITRTGPAGGWSQFIGAGAGDSTVALAAVILLFVLPDGEGGRMLDWETANRIPWGLLILFGGGIAIAKAFELSGLSGSIAASLSFVTAMPPLAMIGIVCLAVTFLTELTSNTATATLLMPVLAAVAVSAKIDPALLMAPAALSASCAFMLPVATAPNAIVFGTGRIATQKMASVGLAINLLGAAAITAVCYLVL